MDKKLIQLWKEDADLIAKYYEDNIKEEGLSPKALGERDEIKDQNFYDALFDNLNLSKKVSVLDIGLGMGDVISYLRNNKGAEIERYLGIDLIQDFVDYSKAKYNQENFDFIKGNFIDDDFSLDEKFDVVVAMGVLVSRAREYNTYLEYFIEKMINHSKDFVLFNIITEVDHSEGNYSNWLGVGEISSIPKLYLIGILEKIKKRKKFNYIINEKRIYKDATDAFVQIKLI